MKQSPNSPVMLNYLWIGPLIEPTVENIHRFGQDTLGPLMMSRSVDPAKNTVQFWCLERNAAQCREFFKAHNSNVVVREIESYLKSSQSDSTVEKYATQLLDLIGKVDSRHRIRDRVTIKVALSYFLLYAEGGYVLDTNVLPEPNHPIDLPVCSTFTLPEFKENGEVKHDVWLMGSSKNDPWPQGSFEYYISTINSLEEMGFDTPAYERGIRSSAMDSLYSQTQSDYELDCWDAPPVTANYLPIPTLGLIKIFCNSHFREEPLTFVRSIAGANAKFPGLLVEFIMLLSTISSSESHVTFSLLMQYMIKPADAKTFLQQKLLEPTFKEALIKALNSSVACLTAFVKNAPDLLMMVLIQEDASIYDVCKKLLETHALAIKATRATTHANTSAFFSPYSKIEKFIGFYSVLRIMEMHLPIPEKIRITGMIQKFLTSKKTWVESAEELLKAEELPDAVKLKLKVIKDQILRSEKVDVDGLIAVAENPYPQQTQSK